MAELGEPGAHSEHDLLAIFSHFMQLICSQIAFDAQGQFAVSARAILECYEAMKESTHSAGLHTPRQPK